RRTLRRRAAASRSCPGAYYRTQVVARRRTHGRPGRTDGGSSLLIDRATPSRAPTYLPHRYAQSVVCPPLPSRVAFATGPRGGSFAGVTSGVRFLGSGS